MQTLGVVFDYSELRMGVVGGPLEQEWLRAQPPDDQQSYLAVRAAMEEQLLSELRVQLAADGVSVTRATGEESHRLVARFTRLNMGFYRFIVNQDSMLSSRLTMGPGQTGSDEILVDVSWTASEDYPTILERMRLCAQHTARIVVQYIDFTTSHP